MIDKTIVPANPVTLYEQRPQVSLVREVST